MRKLKYGILLGIFVAMGSMTTINAGTVAGNKSSLATVSDAGSTDEEGEIGVSTMEELSRFVSNEEELRDAVAYGGVIELNQDILLTKTLNLGSVKIIGHDHKLYTGEFSGIDNLIELKGGELKNLTIETNYEKCAIHGNGKIENVKLISKVEAENVGIKSNFDELTVLNSTIEGYKTGIESYTDRFNCKTSINDTTITRGAYSVDGSIGFKSYRSSFGYSALNNVTILGYGIGVDTAKKVEGGVFKNNNIGLKEVYDINRAKVEKNVVGIEAIYVFNYTNINVSDNKTGIIIGENFVDNKQSITGLVSNNEVGIVIEDDHRRFSFDSLNIRDNTQYDIYSERDIQINKDNLVKYNLEWKDFDKDGISTLRKAYAMVGKGDEFTITKHSNEYSRIKTVKVDNIELAKDKIHTTKDGEGYIHKITIPANADKRVEIKYEYNTLLVHDEVELRNAIQNADGETIYLKSDIALNNTLDIASLSLVNIDGEGHKLYTTNNNLETLVRIPNAINVKLSNLNIVDKRNSIGIPETKAIIVDGNLELLNTNIRNFTKAVVVNPTGTYNKISGEVVDGTNIRQGSDNDTTTNTTDNNTAGGSGGGGSRGGSGGGGSRGGSRGGSGGGGSRGAGAGAGIAKTGLPQTQATFPTIASTLPSLNTGNWEKVNQKWSLKKADGQYARNQWANIASKWYFLDKDGYILIGVYNINNATYNFGNDGAMNLGWVNTNNKWYYFEPVSGAMKKGWLLYNNNWYYLKADGTMAVNEKTADGYQVNNLGIWVR